MMTLRSLFIVFASFVVVLVLLSGIYTVHETEQAIILQFGEPQRVVKEPGLNFKTPFIQRVVYIDKRVLDFDTPKEEVPTLDQKQLIVDSFARYQIIDPLLFYKTVRSEAGVRPRLDSIISSGLRSIFGQVPMANILTDERVNLMRKIADQVNSEAKTFGINVIDVRMKRVDLPEENSQAIFRRMQTYREQEARKIRATGGKIAQQIRADADKQQRIILAEAKKASEIMRGEGEAKATEIYAKAYGKDPKFFDFYRSMQALKLGMDPENTQYIGGADGDFFKYFTDMKGR